MGLLCVYLAFGCAEPVQDIDRTQPNKIKKNVFEGEWYYRQTVVDVNGTAMSSFVALEGDGERVKFQIAENMLIARRAHEDVIGIDAPAYNVPEEFAEEFENFNQADNTGSPVAAFRIRTHFDVQRAYNASTGEQSNVLMENMMDRPWYDRGWMRVDWTMNMIGALTGGIVNMMRMEAVIPPQNEGEDVRWYIECQRKGSEEVVPCDTPDSEVTYVDALTEYITTPRWPDCFLSFFSIPGLFYADCGTERIKVRSSFAKIRNLEDCADCDLTWSLQNDFKAREYNDLDDKKFGFFRMNRVEYDRRYGVRDWGTRQYAQIRNIWKRRLNADGDEIDYHKRDPKPIPYYVNVDHPYDLLDEMGMISDDYDMAFRRIVYTLHNNSAEDAGDEGAKYASVNDVPRMFYICTNPGPADLEAGESAPQEELDSIDDLSKERLLAFYEQSNEAYRLNVCKRPGFGKHMGDVRYSFFNFINRPNQNGPLGYGPSSADPLSGELYNGTSNAYGAAIDTYSQYLLDIINIVNGDLDPRDVGYGRNVEAYFDGLREQLNQQSLEARVSVNAGLISQEKNVSLGAAQVAVQREHTLEALDQIRLKLSQPKIKQLLAAGEEFLRLKNNFQANPLASLKGTAIEQKIIFPEMVKGLSMGAIQNVNDLDEETLEKISPLRGMSPAALKDAYQKQQLQHIQKRIHFAEDGFDPKFLGWAREGRAVKAELEAKGLGEAEVQFGLWKWVRGKAYLGLQEHEVGHSLGLRHNFAGSTDSLNYFPQYWALRQKSFNEDCKVFNEETGEYERKGYKTFDALGLPSRTVAPAGCEVVDEATGQETSTLATDEEHAAVYQEMMEAGLETYSNASIMEYGATFGLNDQAGLALYDYAALAYGYGDLLEVFNTAPNKIEVMQAYDERENFDQAGSYMKRSGNLVTDMLDVDNLDVKTGSGVVEYDNPRVDDQDTYENFNGFRDHGWNYWHYSVIPVMFFDGEGSGKSSEELAENMMISKRVSFENVDQMWKLYDRSLVPASKVREKKLIEVPYKYCEDIFAGASTIDCRRWDTGADDYEILQTIIDRYNSYYVLDSFRRGRLTWGLSLYPLIMRTMSRYLDRALKHYQYWLLKASGRGVAWYNSEHGGLSSSIAAQEAINFLAGILTTPSVGTYLYSNREGHFLNVDSDGLGVSAAGLSREALQDFEADSQFCISVANKGRYQFDQFVENDQGERPYYYPFMLEVKSHFWDKYLAMMTLTNGSVDVLGQDSASNNQSFFIPPQIVFDDELYRLFSGLITENFENNIGICVEADANNNIVTTDVGCPTDCAGKCAASWKPMPLVRNDPAVACSSSNGKNYVVANPYTRAYGNGDFNMRYMAAVFGTSSFQANMNYDWIDMGGIYVKGRGDMPELTAEAALEYEEWEFTDIYGVSNGLTYAAYCPNGYRTNSGDFDPRPGCDMILRMRSLGDRLQLRRIEEALDVGALNNRDVGEDWLNPTDPDRVKEVLRNFPSEGFSEFFDLQNSQEMARFHSELVRHFFFVQ
jgi:hypothetical protein